MSLLAELLQAKEPLFDLTLKQLEDLTDKPGLDTALSGEILAKAYEHAAHLKLDAGFNAKELHYSLINRIKTDNLRIARLAGGKDPDDIADMTPRIIKLANRQPMHRSGWFLKASVAKRLLKNVPPPGLMKALGYNSVDKLIAEQDIYELFVALRFSENAKWMNKEFLPQYKRLKFADFQNREIKLIELDPKKWGYELTASFVNKKIHNLTHSKEMGVVVILPMRRKTLPGFTLMFLPFIFHYLYEVKLYSTYFKLISISKRFGELLLDTLVADTAHVSITQNQRVHWRVIQRYLGKLHDENHPELLQPHVQPEDLHWRHAEEVLYDIDPHMTFWNQMDYVGLILDGETVTFNLMDVTLSYSNGFSFEERNLYHFRDALWNEIFIRYMGQKALETEILQKLDNELIKPEKVTIK